MSRPCRLPDPRWQQGGCASGAALLTNAGGARRLGSRRYYLQHTEFQQLGCWAHALSQERSNVAGKLCCQQAAAARAAFAARVRLHAHASPLTMHFLAAAAWDPSGSMTASRMGSTGSETGGSGQHPAAAVSTNGCAAAGAAAAAER